MRKLGIPSVSVAMTVAVVWAGCGTVLGLSRWIGAGSTGTWDERHPIAQQWYMNWESGSLPFPGEDVMFGLGFSSGNPFTNGNRTVGHLTVSTETSFSLTGRVGDVLTLTGGDLTRTASSSGTQTIAVWVHLGDAGVWDIAGSGALLASGTISGNASLTRTGPGMLIFTGTLSNSGGVSVNEGTVIFDAAAVHPGFGLLRANAGGTILYANGAQVSGGFLRGPGTQFVEAARFTGTTAMADAFVLQQGQATLTSFTNGGRLTNLAPLVWDGGVNTSSGVVRFNDASVSAFSSNGSLTIASGGTLSNSVTDLVLGGGSRTRIESGGQLTLAGSTALELSGALLINDGAISGTTNVRFNSLVAGTGSYGPVNLFDNAVFMPGATASRNIFSPAAVTISGPVSFSADTSLVVELGGSQPGTQHDQILTAGPATLDGTLQVLLAETFVPQAGQSFTVLSSNETIIGRFDRILGQKINATTWLAAIYEPAALRLAVAAPGDASLDGRVDIRDLAILANNWRTDGRDWPGADFTGDGWVDISDLTLLAMNWQSGVPVASPMAGPSLHDALAAMGLGGLSLPAVPEPGTGLWPGMIGSALAAIRRPGRMPPPQTVAIAPASRRVRDRRSPA